MNQKYASEKVTVADSIEAVNNLYIEKGWSDGLPIIPPTETALEKCSPARKETHRKYWPKFLRPGVKPRLRNWRLMPSWPAVSPNICR